MNKYKVEKVVGEGSFGKALLCKRVQDGRRCIVKQISLAKMSRKEAEQTQQESCILARLKHPNIVTFWESFNETSKAISYLFIVMEFADGGDLAALIKNRRGQLFKESQALQYFVQISLAMKHVHDRKILHRDLKSQNIFLTSSGVIKLGDFGIARVLRNTGELAATQIGTPYYMSPEIMDNKRYNSKTDIWSLGCVLYELLALRVPFEGNSMRQLVQNIMNGSYRPISDTFTPALRDLVREMLSKDPKNRPGINGVLSRGVVRDRISQFLDQNQRHNEFSHTVLHGENILMKRPIAQEEAARQVAAPAPGAAVAAVAHRPAVAVGAPALQAAAGPAVAPQQQQQQNKEKANELAALQAEAARIRADMEKMERERQAAAVAERKRLEALREKERLEIARMQLEREAREKKRREERARYEAEIAKRRAFEAIEAEKAAQRAAEERRALRQRPWAEPLVQKPVQPKGRDDILSMQQQQIQIRAARPPPVVQPSIAAPSKNVDPNNKEYLENLQRIARAKDESRLEQYKAQKEIQRAKMIEQEEKQRRDRLLAKQKAEREAEEKARMKAQNDAAAEERRQAERRAQFEREKERMKVEKEKLALRMEQREQERRQREADRLVKLQENPSSAAVRQESRIKPGAESDSSSDDESVPSKPNIVRSESTPANLVIAVPPRAPGQPASAAAASNLAINPKAAKADWLANLEKDMGAIKGQIGKLQQSPKLPPSVGESPVGFAAKEGFSANPSAASRAVGAAEPQRRGDGPSLGIRRSESNPTNLLIAPRQQPAGAAPSNIHAAAKAAKAEWLANLEKDMGAIKGQIGKIQQQSPKYPYPSAVSNSPAVASPVDGFAVGKRNTPASNAASDANTPPTQIVRAGSVKAPATERPSIAKNQIVVRNPASAPMKKSSEPRITLSNAKKGVPEASNRVVSSEVPKRKNSAPPSSVAVSASVDDPRVALADRRQKREQERDALRSFVQAKRKEKGVSSSVDDIQVLRFSPSNDLQAIDSRSEMETRVKISKPSSLASFISEQRRKMKVPGETEDTEIQSPLPQNSPQVVEPRSEIVSSVGASPVAAKEPVKVTESASPDRQVRRPSVGSASDTETTSNENGSGEPTRRPSLTKMITNLFAPKEQKICPMSPQKPVLTLDAQEDFPSPDELESNSVTQSELNEISEGFAPVDLDASLEMDAMLDAMRLVLTDPHSHEHKHNKKRESLVKGQLGTILEASGELNASLREQESVADVAPPVEEDNGNGDGSGSDGGDDDDDDETFEESSLSSFPSIEEGADLGDFEGDDWGEGNETFGGGYTGVDAQEHIHIDYSTNEIDDDDIAAISNPPAYGGDEEVGDAPMAMSLRGDFDAEGPSPPAGSGEEEAEEAADSDALAPMPSSSNAKGGGKGRGVHIDLSASIRRDVIGNIRVSLEQRLGRRRFQRAYDYLRDLKRRMHDEEDAAQSDEEDERMLADMEAILGEDGLKYLDTMYQLITSEDEF